MDLLPEEVLVIIAKYLYPSEILAWSCTCSRMRNALNNPWIWKSFCSFPELYYKNLDKSTIQGYSVFENELNIDPSIQWKVNFMLEKRLLRNWVTGNCTSVEVKTDLEGIYSMVDTINKHGHHWLFLRGLINIEAWNITNFPSIQSSVATDILARTKTTIEAVEDKVISLTFNLVEIYKFEYPDYKLTLLCSFNLQQQDFPSIVPNGEDLDISFRTLLIGNKIIGYRGCAFLVSMILYIWDTNGSKLLEKKVFNKEELGSIHFKGSLTVLEGCSKNQLFMFISSHSPFTRFFKVKLLEMTTFQFTYCTTFEDCLLWDAVVQDSALIVFYRFCSDWYKIIPVEGDSVLSIDPEIGDRRVYKIAIEKLYLNNNLQAHVFGSKLVVRAGDALYTAELTDDVSGLSVLDNEVKCASKLKFIGPKFVLAPYNNFKCEVWDVVSEDKVFDLPAMGEIEGRGTEVTYMKGVPVPPVLALMSGGRVFLVRFCK